jgi:hypothetical protein
MMEKPMEPELTVKEEGKPSWLKRLGLGLVTGTADDRPDGAGKVLAGGRIEDQLAVNAELGQRLFHRRKG